MDLPYIDMNQPWVYMCSLSWTPIPPLTSSHPSGSSQCTSHEHPFSCIEPGLVICFTYDLLAILIPACASSSPAFHMIHSAYKLNKQGDNIQPWRTPFLIWKQSVVPTSSNCCFLTCIQISQEAGQVVWYSHLFQNFPVCYDLHSQRLWHSQWSRSRCFSGTLMLFQWSNGCWLFDLCTIAIVAITNVNFGGVYNSTCLL